MAEKVKFKATIDKIIMYNEENSFGIISCTVNKVLSEKKVHDKNVICKCVKMPHPMLNKQYLCVGELIEDKRYGKQYNLSFIASEYANQITTSTEKRQYLNTLFTQNQVRSMYKTYDEPFDVFKNGDFRDLIQIKGCGTRNAVRWMNKFIENLYIAKIYTELEVYDLSNSVISKLLDVYKSPELVIEKVQKDPYALTELHGIGFMMADKYALQGGIDPLSTQRIKSFVIFYLKSLSDEGFSYVSPNDLLEAMDTTLKIEVPIDIVKLSLRELEYRLWWNDDQSLIGLKSIYNLEKGIAQNLLRLKNSVSNFKYDNVEEKIKSIEKEQGWEYTDEQKQGIYTVLENNVTVITGFGGTGKSSIVTGFLGILNDKYKCAMCCLSGRAASRLTEITGDEGFTIHRLLGFPCENALGGKNGYGYHEENLLDYDIIIVDEISMINGYLFYYLLRAIKSGSKVILLGDPGQLEPIGECNVAKDIISSPHIPTVELTKIHRQAAKSAIITESIKMRNGIQIIPKGWAGVETRGDLQDLTLDCYSDRCNTFHRIMKHFAEKVADDSILELQIIVPQKNGIAGTRNLNNNLQNIYNPDDGELSYVVIFYEYGYEAVLRKGDKVINMVNNYHAHKCIRKMDGYEMGEETAIFNGNIGIITFLNDREMVVDFNTIGEVVIEKTEFKNIELGYAITCHKYQGSQSDEVIVAIDYSFYPSLCRQWLYTAVTRAKKHCTLIAENSALRAATSFDSVSDKTTHLFGLLEELSSQKIEVRKRPVLDW